MMVNIVFLNYLNLSNVKFYFLIGHYVKDLSVLNTDISQTIIVDNSPMSYIFQPGMSDASLKIRAFTLLSDVSENAIDCSSFFDDPSDVELWQVWDYIYVLLIRSPTLMLLFV